MGASNALAAIAMWAGKVPYASMHLLTYMALIAKDTDEHPWFGLGHAALAEHALGRPTPIREADIRAVERAIGPLAEKGAITTDRRASVRRDGPHTVRYRLNLKPAHVPRKASDVNPVDNSPQGQQRPTENVADVPRNPLSRPTESVVTSHGIRGTEEPGGDRRSEKTEEEVTDLETAWSGSRARGHDEDPISPRCLHHPDHPAGTRADGTFACRVCHALGRYPGHDPPRRAIGRAPVPTA